MPTEEQERLEIHDRMPILDLVKCVVGVCLYKSHGLGTQKGVSLGIELEYFLHGLLCLLMRHETDVILSFIRLIGNYCICFRLVIEQLVCFFFFSLVVGWPSHFLFYLFDKLQGIMNHKIISQVILMLVSYVLGFLLILTTAAMDCEIQCPNGTLLMCNTENGLGQCAIQLQENNNSLVLTENLTYYYYEPIYDAYLRMDLAFCGQDLPGVDNVLFFKIQS